MFIPEQSRPITVGKEGHLVRQGDGLFNPRVLGVFAASLAVIATCPARAEECPGKPDALGTSRTLVVEPTEHIRLGMMQYPEALPLDDHEVVLTFDDGPLPPYTTRALSILASECVKATFFLVGRMAKAYPDTVAKFMRLDIRSARIATPIRSRSIA